MRPASRFSSVSGTPAPVVSLAGLGRARPRYVIAAGDDAARGVVRLGHGLEPLGVPALIGMRDPRHRPERAGQVSPGHPGRHPEGRERVWLVYSHDWYTDPEQIIPHELRTLMQQTDQRQFVGLQVMEFEQ